jgi:iron complex transport system ATP-binding protein
MLIANAVSFAYGVSRVLETVSIEVRPGTIVGILGPNGSGKTTLLKLLSGALPPLSGRITLDGIDLSRIPRRVLAHRLAVVPQETQLAFDYSALEVVLMGRYAHLGAFEVEGPHDLAAAEAALAATGTTRFGERPFPTLSGGEKQRVVIAAALAQLDARGGRVPDAAPLLLLDEPTASLDMRYQIELVSLVARLHAERGVTVILTTHDLRFASAVCSEVVLLSKGRVLAQGAPAGVLTRARIGELYEIGADVSSPLLS